MLRKLAVLLSSIFALTLLPGAASALSINPGDTDIVLGLGDTHNANPLIGGQPVFFTHDYSFDVAASIGGETLISVFVPFPGVGNPTILGLTLQWIDVLTALPVPGGTLLVTNAGTGWLENSFMSVLLLGDANPGAADDYILRVTGTASNGGRYDLDVTGGSPVPLPGTIMLFGTVFAGAAGLMGRRRRRALVKAG